MNSSVSPEAEWELTEESIYYAREGGAELAEALSPSSNVCLLFSASIPDLARNGEIGDVVSLCASFPSALSITPAITKFESSHLHTIVASRDMALLASNCAMNSGREAQPGVRADWLAASLRAAFLASGST